MAEAGTVQSLIAPRRYIQGRGVLSSIGKHVAEIGSQPLLIADDNVWKLAGETLSASFKAAGLEFTREVFGGVCSPPGDRPDHRGRQEGQGRRGHRGRGRHHP